MKEVTKGNEPIDYVNINVRGLKKREYFAANCPEVPDWFDIEFEMPKPTAKSTKDKSLWEKDSDFEICRNYENSLIGTAILPKNLQWFADALKNDAIAKQEAYKEWTKQRYFAWRTYYADNLIQQLNK
jgi:hypothetical protein